MKEKIPIYLEIVKMEYLALLQKLEEEANLQKLKFVISKNPYFEDLNYLLPELASRIKPQIKIRETVRKGCMKESRINQPEIFLGEYPFIGINENNEIIFEGVFEETPSVIKEMLFFFKNQKRKWGIINYWNLGSFKKLTSDNGLIHENGVILFNDEKERLQQGEIIKPVHWKILNWWGNVEEEMESYCVSNGNLFRMKALI